MSFARVVGLVDFGPGEGKELEGRSTVAQELQECRKTNPSRHRKDKVQSFKLTAQTSSNDTDNLRFQTFQGDLLGLLEQETRRLLLHVSSTEA